MVQSFKRWTVLKVPHTPTRCSFTTDGARRSWVHRWLRAFSLQTTSQGVFGTSPSVRGGSYSSLDGIRVLSLLWIMSGHSTELILAGLGTEHGSQRSLWSGSRTLTVNSAGFR